MAMRGADLRPLPSQGTGGPRPLIRRGVEDDHEAAAEALALAFADDPAWTHLLPDDASRAERLLVFFTTEIANQVPEHRDLWVVDGAAGAALWAKPGQWRLPIHRVLRVAPRVAPVFGRRLGLALRAQMRGERHHRGLADHWYLDRLGVEPRSQGRGLGGALLAPVLERCDREGLPAYLESSTERNRALYERSGFALTGTFPMPGGGPKIREMWREPPPAG